MPIFDDYRNVSVMSAYAPLNFTGLNWVIISEVDIDVATLNSERSTRLLENASQLDQLAFELREVVENYQV